MRVSDEELVRLMAADNEKAFQILYNRYWDKLLIRAYSILKAHELAEEVVQDSFINLWKKRHTITIKHTFNTYISAVVKYEVLRKLAKQPTTLYMEDIAVVAIHDHSTQNRLDFDDLHAQIEQTVKVLPDKCQLVFRLSREEGLTAKQISDALQISPKTVEAHITKALKTLRVSLGSFFM
ncbi:RNA polymerase sigma-70 factor [Mucilaginibacter auburnensis]|uniref:RNA polymerase sigma-70 factor (ECF subfamily) n=1 Tax=Mucilaginibacter auburnensis TaxID=1457233 RepID=A0A2H9VW89_9SPHI|nr:RNA polymerase sigma-70 factor [Mucilaginibacter auburnensis]PJJ85090.1 RNA polymerase sigma-70 factor (ECF subfamily) [Mucilaginibacter auburnensis]